MQQSPLVSSMMHLRCTNPRQPLHPSRAGSTDLPKLNNDYKSMVDKMSTP